MTQTLTRDQALALYETAKLNTAAARFRDAYTNLSELLNFSTDDADLRELEIAARQQLNDVKLQAADVVDAVEQQLTRLLSTDIEYTPPIGIDIEPTDKYLAEIERMITNSVTQWEAQAQIYLGGWLLAMIEPVQETSYKEFTQKTTDFAIRLRLRLKGQGVIDLCQKLWTRAEELMSDPNRQLGSDAILSRYYDQARDIAIAALGADPDNVDLEVVKQYAVSERERFAIGAQVMTSAVLEEQFDRSLKELDGLPADQPVPSFRFLPNAQGQLEGRQERYIPAAEARRRLLEMANNWAHSKAQEYIDRAEIALRNHQPEAAQLELANQSKINTFLDSTDKNEFRKLESRIEEELHRLGRAQTNAAQAREYLPDRPFDAWMLYQEAVKVYEWASILPDTRNAIIKQLRLTLETRHREAEQAFDGRNFNVLNGIVTNTRNQFAAITEPELSVLLEAIRTFGEQARIYSNRLLTAQNRLQEIERGMRSNPQDAQDQLDALERDFDDVRDGLIELANIRRDVRLQSNAVAELEHLRKFVTQKNLAEVRQAYEDAKAASGKFPNDANFKQLVEKLRLHTLFLDAQRDESNGLYQNALKKYGEVAETRDHEDAGSARINLNEVQEAVTASADITRRLQEAERLLDKDPAEAYFRLRKLDIRNPEQRAERDSLSIEARNQAHVAIVERLRIASRLGEDALLPLHSLQSDLKILGELGLHDDQSPWTNELGAQMAVQKAQILTDEAFRVGALDQMSETIKAWEDAVKLTELSGKTSLITRAKAQLNKTRKAHLYIRCNLFLRWLKENTADDPDAMAAEGTNIENEIKRLQTLYTNDAEVELWRARLIFVTGAQSLKPSRREECFARAESIAASAKTMLVGSSHDDDLLKEADDLVKLAPIGANIAKTMQKIESLYGEKQRTVKRLFEAQKLWKTDVMLLLKKHNTNGDFNKVQQWWDTLNQQVINHLRAEIGSDYIETEHFAPLAMLLVLEPNDQTARGVLDRLTEYDASVSVKVKDFIDNLKTAHGIAGENGHQILSNQRGQAEEMGEDLDAISQLATLYLDDKDAKRAKSMQTILESVNRSQLNLNVEVDKLDKLNKDVTKILDRLRLEQQTGKFNESQTSLSELQREFSLHPAVAYVETERQSRIEERAELSKAVTNIKTLIEAEQYDKALYQMQIIQAEKLEMYALGSGFEITDPNAPNNPVRTWHKILKLVTLRSESGAVPRVLAFAEQFDDYTSGKGAITGSLPPVRRATEWETIRKQVETYIAYGQFEEARNELLRGTSNTGDHNRFSLEEVNNLIMNPPYIQPIPNDELEAATRDISERYPLACKYAGSKCGEDILRQMEQKVVPYYVKALQEANHLDIRISKAYKQWNEGWVEWEIAIKDIAVQFGDKGIHGRLSGTAKENMKGAIQRAYNAYLRCKAACEERDALKEMIDGLFLYRHALKRTGFTPVEPVKESVDVDRAVL